MLDACSLPGASSPKWQCGWELILRLPDGPWWQLGRTQGGRTGGGAGVVVPRPRWSRTWIVGGQAISGQHRSRDSSAVQPGRGAPADVTRRVAAYYPICSAMRWPTGSDMQIAAATFTFSERGRRVSALSRSREEAARAVTGTVRHELRLVPVTWPGCGAHRDEKRARPLPLQKTTSGHTAALGRRQDNAPRRLRGSPAKRPER